MGFFDELKKIGEEAKGVWNSGGVDPNNWQEKWPQDIWNSHVKRGISDRKIHVKDVEVDKLWVAVHLDEGEPLKVLATDGRPLGVFSWPVKNDALVIERQGAHIPIVYNWTANSYLFSHFTDDAVGLGIKYMQGKGNPMIDEFLPGILNVGKKLWEKLAGQAPDTEVRFAGNIRHTQKMIIPVAGVMRQITFIWLRIEHPEYGNISCYYDDRARGAVKDYLLPPQNAEVKVHGDLIEEVWIVLIKRMWFGNRQII